MRWSFFILLNVLTPGAGVDFIVSFCCDPRSFCFQLFVCRYQSFGSFAKLVLYALINT
jgi:hypothetical protein